MPFSSRQYNESPELLELSTSTIRIFSGSRSHHVRVLSSVSVFSVGNNLSRMQDENFGLTRFLPSPFPISHADRNLFGAVSLYLSFFLYRALFPPCHLNVHSHIRACAL